MHMCGCTSVHMYVCVYTTIFLVCACVWYLYDHTWKCCNSNKIERELIPNCTEVSPVSSASSSSQSSRCCSRVRRMNTFSSNYQKSDTCSDDSEMCTSVVDIVLFYGFS